MESAKNRILEIKEKGYDIDFGRIFENSFENYKKIALIAGITILLVTILIMAIAVGLFAIFWGFSSMTDTLADLKLENFSVLHILIYVTVLSLISGFASPITAGMLKMAHNAAKNEEFSVGTAFEYYSSSHFKELFLATFCISIWTIGITTLLDYLGIRFVRAILTYIISFFTFLTLPLIIFGNLNALEAIKGSFTVVSKQFFILLGLLIVSFIFAFLGLIGFCIGIFFTIPFIYSMYYCIYSDSIGIIDEESEI